MSDNKPMISDEAVEAAAYTVGEAVYGDLTPREAASQILEAAAPYMQVQAAQSDSDAILAILEAAGVDKANQFDALVAFQKLITNRSQT
jgi:hypothetical protein